MKATEFAGNIAAPLSTRVALNTTKFAARLSWKIDRHCTGQQVDCTCSSWRCFSV